MVIWRGDNEDAIEYVSSFGYCVFRGFFEECDVLRARNEMLSLLERDLCARANTDCKRATRLDQEHYQASLTSMMHTRLFPSWESPTFARMLAEMFESNIIADFMAKIVGDHYRLRVDLIRRSTGVDDTVDDFQLPHEWHRDTPGEFTFGIFFDDFSAPGSGGTAVVPGTHMEKFDPRWDLLLAKKARPLRDDFMSTSLKNFPEEYYAHAHWNQLVRSEIENSVVEIRGRPGDIYFFLNDTWHGRYPNKSGRQLMVARVGGFPTDFFFKDDIRLPANPSVLPLTLQRCYSAEQPINRTLDTLVRRIQLRPTRSASREKAAMEKIELMRLIRSEREVL